MSSKLTESAQRTVAAIKARLANPAPIVPLVGPIKMREPKLWRFEYRTRETPDSEWSTWRRWQCYEKDRKNAICNLRAKLWVKGFLSDQQEFKIIPSWRPRKHKKYRSGPRQYPYKDKPTRFWKETI